MKPWLGGRAPGKAEPWPVAWHAACALPLVAVIVVFCVGHAWKGPLFLEPLLAVPPALAGIGAATPRRPLIYGAVSLAAILVISIRSFGTTPALFVTTVIAVVAVTVLSTEGAVRTARRNQQLAKVMTVAEVAQRALLRPLPSRVGALELSVLYVAAAAEAQVGGDLYEVARTEYGIRLIMGDVRGKGLGAVEVAADILGVFREAAHEVYTLAEVARRLDASLARRHASTEEFVTAVLVEIDPAITSLNIYNCGHPAPILLAANAGAPPRVAVADVPVPAPPLGIMSLGDCTSAGRTLPFGPGDALLLYTDGVTEARDSRRQFYPLAERLAELAASDGKRSAAGVSGLLERLREDVLRHTRAPLDDDAALLLVRAVSPSMASVDGPDGRAGQSLPHIAPAAPAQASPTANP